MLLREGEIGAEILAFKRQAETKAENRSGPSPAAAFK
jgi:hypothetical protein